jgi:RNA polymerase sigma factor (sigma-70 family)
MAGRIAAFALENEIRALFGVGALGAMPDRTLLEQFGRGGEASEAAFATLVERHGPMVLRVCRQLLYDGHLAEDAFQVTFMLLARRARSIHDPDALAGWLHRVARRVALRIQTGIRRRRGREDGLANEVAVRDRDLLERDEVRAIVHEEIDRLRETQRLPILLCAVEGLSHEEAAHRLRWPVGTVKSRLVRGRRRLEGRLARRGLAPAVALLAGVAGNSASATTVPLALAVAATRNAFQAAAGYPNAVAPVSGGDAEPISAVFRGELTAIALAKVKLGLGLLTAAAAALLIGLTLAGSFGRRALPAGAQAQTLEQPAVAHAQDLRRPVAPAPIVARTEPPPIADAGRLDSRYPNVLPQRERGNAIVEDPKRQLSPFGKEVDRALREGVRFLKAQQRDDGSWAEIENESKTGITSLVTLALLAAGETIDSAAVRDALAFLRGFGPGDLHSTYAISLQTQVFAAATPESDKRRITDNVEWLERAQFKPGDIQRWLGCWSYTDQKRSRPGDNSNSQFGLLGLYAASEAGVPVNPAVWELARLYWERAQKRDGSWAYTPDSANSTASMTCAGVSSLVIAGQRTLHDPESLAGETIANCGKRGTNRKLQAGIDWLANHFRIDENSGAGKQWRFYYLCGLERAGRLAGVPFFGQHDWYQAGAEALLGERNKLNGSWEGALFEKNPVLATSFATLFLASGRVPVLINKLKHAPLDDWNNDPDDVRSLVGTVARGWRHPLSWQIVDSTKATVPDLLRAPILFVNGHKAPEFTDAEKTKLRAYVERGGFIFAEACCGSADFDRGFRNVMADVFPEDERLRAFTEDHPIWRVMHRLNPEIHPLWGIRRGARTVVVYSPQDQSCFWNQSERHPGNPAVVKAIRVGQNVIEYATDRTLPPDKLSEP